MSDEKSPELDPRPGAPDSRRTAVESLGSTKVTRRTIAATVAWAVPALVLAPAAQAATCSMTPNLTTTKTATTANQVGGTLSTVTVSVPSSNVTAITFEVIGGGGGGNGGRGADLSGTIPISALGGATSLTLIAGAGGQFRGPATSVGGLGYGNGGSGVGTPSLSGVGGAGGGGGGEAGSLSNAASTLGTESYAPFTFGSGGQPAGPGQVGNGETSPNNRFFRKSDHFVVITSPGAGGGTSTGGTVPPVTVDPSVASQTQVRLGQPGTGPSSTGGNGGNGGAALTSPPAWPFANGGAGGGGGYTGGAGGSNIGWSDGTGFAEVANWGGGGASFVNSNITNLVTGLGPQGINGTTDGPMGSVRITFVCG